MPKIGEVVTFVDGTMQEKHAVITQVWSDACVNLDVEDGTKPTSVLHRSFFTGQVPTGHFWTERELDTDA